MDSSGGKVSRAHGWTAGLVVLAICLAATVLIWQSTGVRGELRTVSGLLLQGDPEPMRAWLLEFGAWAPLLSALLYLLSALIPVIPGFVLAIANAMLFGAFWGGLLSFISATVAAAVCFGLARAVGRPGVVRIISRESLLRMDSFMERRGLLAVFLGRLIPFINPDILSYAAGVTGIGWVPFLLAMGVGALPATVFYSIVGALALDSTGWVVGMVTAVTILPLALLWAFRNRLRA